MKIEAWVHPHHQLCRLGRHSWRVARLFELSRELPVPRRMCQTGHFAR